ncbi:hypothetical protein P8452_43063 [Trifolium repens]|nr:hypothetical protein P8452_43063 [Trifolium repens]
MHLHGNDSYLSPCFTVAKAFTLNEPTNVILEFINADNRFKVHFIKNETESELQFIAAIDFNQPAAYTWIKKITPAVANKKWVNALNLPRDIVRFAFSDAHSIILKCANNDQVIKCKVITTTRNRKCVENFLSTGWYQYVRHNNLIVGHELNFKLYVQTMVLHMQITPPNMNR